MQRTTMTLRRASPTLAILGLLCAVWYGWHRMIVHDADATGQEIDQPSSEERTQVALSDVKLAAAKIQTALVEQRQQRASVIVPARLAYDEALRVSVRLGTAGMLTEVSVKPGDQVSARQVLAKMSSPEVGTARADELQKLAELELARRQAAWDSSRAASVNNLVEAIRQRQSPEEIRQNFLDQKIGAAREKLLSAYTDQLLAETMVTRIAGAADSGALPARTIDERRRALESSGATLQGVVEQTLFDADQAARTSQIQLDDARRRWEIAAGRVATLLGVTRAALPDADSTPSEGTDTPQPSALDLSVIEVRSPRSGTVEQKYFNENERVEAGSELFVVADTTQLWLKADVRESQWNALALSAGQEIKASSPAIPNETLSATIVRMGREVDPQTNAIPLVATIDNRQGRLRPGLYMRAELPLGETTSQVMIPESAVAVHDGIPFVFLTSDGHTFVRRDVRVGTSHDGWTEVIAGVRVGERIATQGVFHLKSELLLENEE